MTCTCQWKAPPATPAEIVAETLTVTVSSAGATRMDDRQRRRHGSDARRKGISDECRADDLTFEAGVDADATAQPDATDHRALRFLTAGSV